MKLRFTKMHGAGNDFVVINGIDQKIRFTPEQWRFLADRRFGIGADQILLVEKTTKKSADFRYRIFNADGGEVEQCGNGARAFVRFVTDQGMTDKHRIKVETMAGIIELQLEKNGNVTVNMGPPVFEPENVPFDTTGLRGHAEQRAMLWPLYFENDGQKGKNLMLSVLSMGNPHAVLLVDSTEKAPVAQEGPVIESHRRFPNRVNAGFMEIVDRNRIKLRVYERGAGETLACGTGACAAVVSGICRGLLDSPVNVMMAGGELLIAWEGEGNPVMMTGPAVRVFDGEINM
ncbi:diaminopimelate epimerase [Oxalobacter vibrioformis]|uniref:Diaminopimelate epimerase n=1 Tax=Oxalobacter vibrioformis TaxID=933080 RepID=A0A9E9P3P7_9BURK|nr:diaminopimelate epimerase [Oxalobacter vibrioformis]WAW09346.1 diaminopimelate epimerase [Oxalobacter vibrioformis]